MKVLDTTHYLSNSEVKTFLKNKRAQHAREDAADRAAGRTPTKRPPNLLNALEKHERHLDSDAYPYSKNPSAYEGKNDVKSIQTFSKETMRRIQVPLVAKYKGYIANKVMTVQEAKRKLGAEQEKKELTEAELLMIYNHAPVCAEMLQPMIEDWEERFTPEELDVLVECIKEVFRVDELGIKVKEESEPAEPAEPVR